MKKIIIALVIVAAAASAGFAQYRAMEKRDNMMIEGRPFFTDGSIYNNYDLLGSPLGIFDIDSSHVSVELGYRYLGLGGGNGHYLGGQTLRMGAPGRAFFEVFYGPDFLSNNSSANSAKLPLHRFGFTLAGRPVSGHFGTSISAEGYIGTQEWDGNGNKRALMGLERLRLDMGSQAHDLVRANFYLNFTARLDSLYIPNGGRTDFAFQTNLPEFGGGIDFGGEGVPVRSNLSFSYVFSRFVYSGTVNQGSPPATNAYGNANAIRNDSLRFVWLTRGEFPIIEELMVRPGLMLGFSRNAGREHGPDNDDNYPHKINAAIPGRDYGLNGFYFGIGTGIGAFKYADLHVEYSLAAMSLKLGDVYRSQDSTFVNSRLLHHTAFGMSASIHEFLDLPFNITPRIAYFISGSAGIIDAVHSSLDPLNAAPGRSKGYLYTPHAFLHGFERTSGFTFGVDGQVFEEKLSTSFWMTFLSKSTESKGGMELGVSVGFSM
ncbi:MAG: hypothetical protein LBC70_09505 [Chitinispirillales bacterium]|nr:hypothetical protein [Chitinispirillales bacterium]